MARSPPSRATRETSSRSDAARMTAGLAGPYRPTTIASVERISRSARPVEISRYDVTTFHDRVRRSAGVPPDAPSTVTRRARSRSATPSTAPLVIGVAESRTASIASSVAARACGRGTLIVCPASRFTASGVVPNCARVSGMTDAPASVSIASRSPSRCCRASAACSIRSAARASSTRSEANRPAIAVTPIEGSRARATR